MIERRKAPPEATAKANEPPLKATFDREVRFGVDRARTISDGGLFASRELDGALRLTTTAVPTLAECRRLLAPTVRPLAASDDLLVGYEDVSNVDRLARAPAMRALLPRPVPA